MSPCLLALVLMPNAAYSFPGARNLVGTMNPLRVLRRQSVSARVPTSSISEDELMQQMGAGGRDQRPQQRSSDWPSVPESTTHSVPQVSSNSLRVSIGSQEFELLSGLDKSLAGTADPEGRGLFVSFSGRKEQSEHLITLGKLSCSRLVAGARTKRWWMGPSFGSDVTAIPPETQFVLLELAEGAYAMLLPLVDGSMRATLRGADERKRTQRARAKGKGPGPDSNLVAHVQSGDSSTVAGGMERMMFVGTGDDPFELLRRSFRAASDALGTFDVSSRKRVPEDIDNFGWCTWDAFYQAVDPDGIRAGVASLHGLGTPPRMLIIDDGWQTVVQDGTDEIGEVKGGAEQMSSETSEEEARELNKPQEATDANPMVTAVVDLYRTKVDGADTDTNAVRIWRALANGVLKSNLRRFFAEKTEFSKRLGAFEANGKFEDEERGISLRSLLESLRTDFGDLSVYCWHTLGGYWGGISVESDSMQPLNPSNRVPKPTNSLLEVEPQLAWDAAALNGCGQGEIGSEGKLFNGIHSYLADAGVDGVKIDAQSGLGPFGAGAGGGPEFVRRSVRAMEASVSEYFEGNRCINCMCHSTENLFNYRATNLLRAADDFYPSDAASQPVHLAHVACALHHAPQLPSRPNSQQHPPHTPCCVPVPSLSPDQPHSIVVCSNPPCALAVNSLFLAEIGIPDWDMFTSTHKDAGMHAAARAVSGGPLYVSDRPGAHDPELLRKLVLPDGTQLRCSGAGRPTRDALFADPNTDGRSALKVWNVNAKTGVIAVFNVQGSRWDRKVRAFVVDDELASLQVATSVRAEDVEGLQASQQPMRQQSISRTSTASVGLDAGVVVPVRQGRGQTAGQGAAQREAERAAVVSSDGTAEAVGEVEAEKATAALAEDGEDEDEICISSEDDIDGTERTDDTDDTDDTDSSSECIIRPSSVLFGQNSRELIQLAQGEAHSLTLGPREYELFTVAPVQHRGRASFAPLGLLTMFNGGGAVMDSSFANGQLRALQARVSLRATDTFGAYCEPRPRQVRIEGQREPLEFEYDEASCLLSVAMPRSAEPAQLIIDFPRAWRPGGKRTDAAY